ncbi:MAG: phosphatidylglycerol lysyltransferase domain-containing protein [Ktedonobacterales bacterium]
MRTARRMILFCGVALVNILTTLLPVLPMRYVLLAHRLPQPLILGAQHVTLFAGVTMLLLAYPAARGHRRAAYALMGCAAVAIVANVLKGLDVEEAIINAILLGVLWETRAALHDIPLRYTVVDLARLAVGLLLLVKLYDLLGKGMLNGLRLLAVWGRHTFPWAERAVHIATAKLPLEHAWFDESQLLLPLFLLGIFLALSWTSLLRLKEHYDGDGDLYNRFGRASHNSLAYLARRSDVSRFVDPDGRGAVTYRQVGRVAVQVGAILAAPADRSAVYRGFRAYCKTQHLLPAAAALAAEERPIAAACGMRTLTIGTEAVVDLADFALEKLAKKMRWVRRSLSKRGFSAIVLSAAELPAPTRVALDRIDAEWRAARGGQTHGCCMTLGRFPTHSDPDCLIGILNDPEGQPLAYLTLLPGGEGYYSLDLTRRTHTAPNATMEFLMIEVLNALKQRGASAVSLNFSTFSSLSTSRLGRLALKFAGQAVQLGSLEAFNAKFRPRWEPRYMAFPSWLALPDVAYAMLAVEGVDRMLLNAAARSLRYLRPTAPEQEPRLEPRWQSEGA